MSLSYELTLAPLKVSSHFFLSTQHYQKDFTALGSGGNRAF